MVRHGRSSGRRVRTGMLVALALAGVAAPARAGERWIGTWNAPLLWRCIEVAGALDETGAVELRVGTGRERLPLPEAMLHRSADSVDVVVDWDGTHILMSGTVRGDEASGELRVQRGEEILSEGGWTLARTRDASMSAGELLGRVRAAIGVAPDGAPDGVRIAQNPGGDDISPLRPPPDPPVWSVSVAHDGRLSARDEGMPSVVFDGTRVHTVRAPFGSLSSDGRMQDKLFLAAATRGGMPFLADVALDLSVAERGAGAEKRLVLTMLTTRGVAPARILIDPVTFLPERAEVEWDAGSWTVSFRDWSDYGGVRWPARCVTSYRGREQIWSTVSVEKGAGRIDPPVPTDATYDRAASPELAGIHGEGDDGHLFVRPLVNGKEAGWFHVDTGAPFVVLDTKVADELGLPVLREMGPRSIRRVDELRIGQLTLHDCIVMVQDSSEASAPPGEHRAGVIGGSVFERAIVEFDYGGRRLAVWAPDAFAEEGLAWQPMSVESAPVVVARFDGGEDRFYLDTGKGGTVSFSSQGALRHGLPGSRATTEVGNLTVVGETVELATTIDWFELGGETFRSPTVRIKIPGTPNDDVTGTAGWIGRGFFGARRVVFDYAGGRIA
ncbi:retropepsin-like domain-containing protein, partial [bacterium]|nr:retropepsin-like domain-containing protein [bacterium]